MTDFHRDVYLLLGLPLDAIDMDGAVSQVYGAATRRNPCFISTPNLNFLIACLEDKEFRDSVICSDLSVADGMPLVWVARLFDVPIRERVAGSSLFDKLRTSAENRLSVFFFGGMEGAAEAACRQLQREGGGLTCVGYEAPGFGSIEEMSGDATICRINASNADFLLVALGAKKGQAWIERNRARIQVPVVSHLGAVLNFVAGTVNRAPAWTHRKGLEWLWRIKEEPALWRRYWHDGLAFLALFITRVVPYAFYLHFHRANAAELEAAAARAFQQGQYQVIELRGAWTHTNLAPLRECFASAAQAQRDVRLELGGVSYIDSAFLGLVTLLYGHQKQQRKNLVIDSAAKPVRRVVRYCCGEFLYERTAELPAGVDLHGGRAGSGALSSRGNLTTPYCESMSTRALAMTSMRTALLLAGLMFAATIGTMAARPEIKVSDEKPVQLESMIPRQFGTWREEPQKFAQVVNPQTQELLDKLYSQIVSRVYVDRDGYRIMLSLAYGRDQRGSLQAHKPEVCYPAQGFNIEKNEAGTLPTAYGAIPVRRLFGVLGARREPVTYWFTVGDEAVMGPTQKKLVELRFGLTGRIPDGLLFRVSSIDTDLTRAYRRQDDFTNQLLQAVPASDRTRLSGLAGAAGT